MSDGKFKPLEDDVEEDKKTVEGDPFDDEDGSIEIDETEYVDMVDEGYFAPSYLVLILMCVLIVFVVVIIGVLVSGAVKDDDSSSRDGDLIPTPSPTSAPVAPTASPVMVPTMSCSLCEFGEITEPDAEITFPFQPTRTCAELESAAQGGNFTQAQCEEWQPFVRTICGCVDTKACTSICGDPSFVITNPDMAVDLSDLGIEGLEFETCQSLQDFQNEGSIPVELCAGIQDAVAPVCGCQGPPPVSCEICPNATVTDIDGQVSIPGGFISERCDELEIFASEGLITETDCGFIQDSNSVCQCGTTTPEDLLLQRLQDSVGPNIFVEGTTEYMVGQYLLNEDPRFQNSTRRFRRLQPLNDEPLDPFFTETFNNTEESTEEEPVEDGPGPTVTMTPFEAIDLFSLSDEEVLQRYLADLLYFQTSDNRATPWELTDCAHDSAGVMEIRRDLQTFDEDICVFTDGTPAFRWLSYASECEWGGVICDDDNIITGFDLGGVGMTGNFASSITGLPSLLGVDFSYNFLTGTIPAAYFGPKSLLRGMNIQNNLLVGTMPVIENAGELQTLIASNNGLGGSLPIVGAAEKLLILDVTGNQMTGSLDALAGAPSILKIDVSNNRFTGNLTFLGAQSDLRSFQAKNNFLSGVIPSTINGLNDLSFLDLSNNNLDGTLPPEVGALRMLEFANFSSNAFSGTLPVDLGFLPELETLDLFENFFNGTLPESLGNLDKLTSLDVGKNDIVGGTPPGLCPLDFLAADCDELECECCTECCSVNGTAVCTPV